MLIDQAQALKLSGAQPRNSSGDLAVPRSWRVRSIASHARSPLENIPNRGVRNKEQRVQKEAYYKRSS